MSAILKRGASAAILMSSMTLLAACSPKPPAAASAETAKDEAAVRAMEDTAVAAFNGRHADAFAATYVPDSVVVAPGVPVSRGPAAIAKSEGAAMADPAAHFALKIEKIEVSKSGDLAYALWRYDSASTDPKTKKVVHELGSGVDTLRKGADGTWKFVVSINAAAPDSATAATS
ncbi:MAG TPA: SgcJ/EcaC family oxidoreductase [Caulobacteraceae bacterium]